MKNELIVKILTHQQLNLPHVQRGASGPGHLPDATCNVVNRLVTELANLPVPRVAEKVHLI